LCETKKSKKIKGEIKMQVLAGWTKEIRFEVVVVKNGNSFVINGIEVKKLSDELLSALDEHDDWITIPSGEAIDVLVEAKIDGTDEEVTNGTTFESDFVEVYNLMLDDIDIEEGSEVWEALIDDIKQGDYEVVDREPRWEDR